jgi:peptide alpha-N-acetyltransferase
MVENKQELAPVDPEKITFRTYESEEDLQTIIKYMELNLSEPYPIYTYRYFVQKWPELCFLAMYEGECIGCVVSKLENQRKKDSALVRYRGYIAMLAVDPTRRRCGLGRKLVQISIDAMKEANADEVILETELENQAALNLYHCK